RTLTTRSSFWTRAVNRMHPPRSMNFAALFKVGDDLIQSHRVSAQPDGFLWTPDEQPMLTGLDNRSGRLDRFFDRFANLDSFKPQLNLPPHQPRDIKQIIDEAGHV